MSDRHPVSPEFLFPSTCFDCACSSYGQRRQYMGFCGGSNRYGKETQATVDVLTKSDGLSDGLRQAVDFMYHS